jgi:putative flippase GtrA
MSGPARSGTPFTLDGVIDGSHRSTNVDHPPLLIQLIRFALTGGVAGIVDFGILTALTQLGMGHTVAKAISFLFGTTTAYLLNRRWTFRAGPSRGRFLGVVVLYGVTFCVQVGLFALLYSLFTGHLARFWVQTVSFVIAQGFATVVNFVVQRTVIFRLMR